MLIRKLNVEFRYFIFISAFITLIGSTIFAFILMLIYQQLSKSESNLFPDMILICFTWGLVLSILSSLGGFASLFQISILLKIYKMGLSVYILFLNVSVLFMIIYRKDIWNDFISHMKTSVLKYYMRDDVYRSLINNYQVRNALYLKDYKA